MNITNRNRKSNNKATQEGTKRRPRGNYKGAKSDPMQNRKGTMKETRENQKEPRANKTGSTRKPEGTKGEPRRHQQEIQAEPRGREAKGTLPINICWKTPASSLPSKLLSHEKGAWMCGNEHIRVFRHFPNEPCVLACMMLRGELCFPTWKH